MLRSTATIVLGCLVALGLLGCNCDTPPPAEPDEAFEVIKTLPANGETDVLVSGTIDIEFNHDLRDEQVVLSDSIIFFEPVNAPHVVSKVAPRRIQVQLLQPLPYGATISAVVQGLQDTDNKPLHAYEFTFVTEIDIEPPFAPTPAFSYEVTRDDYYDITGGREPYTYIWVGYSSTLTDTEIGLSRYAEGSDDPFSLAERFTVRVPLDEGANRVGLLSEDLAGNQSEPVFVTVVRDSLAPAMPILDASPASPTSESQLVLSGTVEADAELQVYLNGEFVAVSTDNGNWALTLPLLEGSNTVKLLAVDEAQNTSVPLELSVVLDTLAPQLTVNTIPTRSAAACVTVAGSVNETATIYVNDVLIATANSWNHCQTLQVDTINSIEIAAFDSLGNSTQKKYYVSQGDAPALLKILPEAGTSVTGGSDATVLLFFDQPIAAIPASGVLSNHRHSYTQVDLASTNGPQTISVDFTARNSYSQSAVLDFAQAFTWTSGATANVITNVTTTPLDNRGLRWSIDITSTVGDWFVVAATQTSITGTILSAVVQGDTLPLTLTSPLPWAPMDITVTAYAANGTTAYTHRRLYPSSSFVSIGMPFPDRNDDDVGAFALAAIPAVTDPSQWDVYVGASSAATIARIAPTGTGLLGFDGSYGVTSYVTGPSGFGSAITFSASQLFVAADSGSRCIYDTVLPLALPSFSAAQQFVCQDGAPGNHLHYDPISDRLWSANPAASIGAESGAVQQWSPVDASQTYALAGFSDFLALRGFRGLTSGPMQLFLHRGQGSSQSYELFTGSQNLGSDTPSADFNYAFAGGDFDGDGHPDALVFTDNAFATLTPIHIYGYAGGMAGDLQRELSIDLSGWQDFCVYAMSAVADFNGDGADDILCSSADTDYLQRAIIVWGAPGFFATSHLRASVVNEPMGETMASVRSQAIHVLPDLNADGLPELIAQHAGHNQPLVIYP